MPKYVVIAEDEPKPDLIIGLNALSRHLGICVATLSRWRKHQGFPACYLPDGRIATTKSLIDQWVIARMQCKTKYNMSPGPPRKLRANNQQVTS